MKNITLLFASALLLTAFADKPKISEWRGLNRTGIYQESNLLKEWPVNGPKEIWNIGNLGNGYVSPVFDDESFFISGEIDSMSILYRFNLKGKELWHTTLGKEWVKTHRGTRSVPTIADNLLYIGTGVGNLYCVNKENGTIVWSKDLEKDFAGSLPRHGHSEAPVIDGNKVFWTSGGKENNVVALDRFSGKILWHNTGLGERPGYNPPKLIELPSGNIFITFSAYHMMGFDVQTGKLLWSHEQDNTPPDERKPGNGDTHSNTVLFENGSIYYAEGDGNGGVKLELNGDGSKITEIWRNKGFDSFMGGIVKIGDYIYGGGTAKPMLLSINASSGIITDSLRIGSGAIISADNMLYYYTQKGEMILLSYNQGKLQKVSSFSIKEGTAQHFAHPVINKGVLYQRHGNSLMAFDIKKK